MGFGSGSCVHRFESYLQYDISGAVYSCGESALCMQLLRPRWNASKDVVSQGGS